MSALTPSVSERPVDPIEERIAGIERTLHNNGDVIGIAGLWGIDMRWLIAALRASQAEAAARQTDVERLDEMGRWNMPYEIDNFPDRCFVTIRGSRGQSLRWSEATLRETVDAIIAKEPGLTPADLRAMVRPQPDTPTAPSSPTMDATP